MTTNSVSIIIWEKNPVHYISNEHSAQMDVKNAVSASDVNDGVNTDSACCSDDARNIAVDSCVLHSALDFLYNSAYIN